MAKISAYEKVTQIIIDKLEQGVVPWQKPWVGGLPKNLKTKKPYRGINMLVLMAQDYSCPYWATFNQIKDLGGTVKKGEHGTPIVFWGSVNAKTETEDGDEDGRKISYCKAYTVFNLEQTTLEIPVEELEKEEDDACEGAEKVYAHMPHAPTLIHGGGRAYYRPATDSVQLPEQKSFVSKNKYYSTQYHELVHSTGHSSRVGCELNTNMRSDSYSKEELIAEFGAAFLCCHANVTNEKTIENSAAYIGSWLQRIREDKKLLVSAASQAQKAVDYILGE